MSKEKTRGAPRDPLDVKEREGAQVQSFFHCPGRWGGRPLGSNNPFRDLEQVSKVPTQPKLEGSWLDPRREGRGQSLDLGIHVSRPLTFTACFQAGGAVEKF